MPPEISKNKFERLYRHYNRREFVHPDPLEFLYHYEDPCDREIVAFVASALAYGRVAHILKSVSSVLERMKPTPWVFLKRASLKTMRQTFSGFKHRFTNDQKLCAMFFGMKKVLEHHGSLQACFSAGLNDDDNTILPALSAFTRELAVCADDNLKHLVPSLTKSSACKRLNLFLRWMVRSDNVDPGGWENVPASKLIVPVDTHMHKICHLLGFTKRKHADMRAAVEITKAFRSIAPADPVRYDFSLTRLGIRKDADMAAFLKQFGGTSP
ncbi:MAG: TIGR02757 family protein [Thermodesulfobacteriota bacterium]|nr:TIGR02757 family protein [Thermodesulfobacteriota bacterium]